jgi:hypothetical protein
MPTKPHVYGGDAPFLLVHAADRERVVRYLADAGVAMILTTEGTSLSRVELPDYDRHQACRLVEQMNRQLRREQLDNGGSNEAVSFSLPNRLQSRRLLDD